MNVASVGRRALIAMGWIVHLSLFSATAAELETESSTGQESGQTSDLFPDIAAGGSGVWIAVWQTSDELAGESGEGSSFGIGADSDIVFVRSTDGGANWSRPRPLSPAAETDSGGDFTPRLATDSEGNWVCVWISTDSLVGRIGTDTDVVVSRSTDDGQTWSAPEPVTLSAEVDDARGADLSPVIAFGGGTFIIAYEVFGGFGPDSDLVVVRSTDGGRSWGDLISIKSTPAEDFAADFSPRLATDGRGNWLCVWWSDNLVSEPYPSGPSRPFAILGSFSADDGLTWTTPEPISDGADLGPASGPDQRFASVARAGDRWNVVWESVRHVGAGPQGLGLSSKFGSNREGESAATSARAPASALGIFLSSATGPASDWTRPERIAPSELASESSVAPLLRFPVIETSIDGRSVIAWESTSADSGSRIQSVALSDGDTDGDTEGYGDEGDRQIVDLTGELGTDTPGIRFMNPSIEADGDTWLVIWESCLQGDSGGQGVPTGTGEAPNTEIRYVYAARSSDGARTWTAPYRLD